MQNISTVDLDTLAKIAIEVAYQPTVRYEGTWYEQKEVYAEIDRRVRFGLVV